MNNLGGRGEEEKPRMTHKPRRESYYARLPEAECSPFLHVSENKETDQSNDWKNPHRKAQK